MKNQKSFQCFVQYCRFSSLSLNEPREEAEIKIDGISFVPRDIQLAASTPTRHDDGKLVHLSSQPKTIEPPTHSPSSSAALHFRYTLYWQKGSRHTPQTVFFFTFTAYILLAGKTSLKDVNLVSFFSGPRLLGLCIWMPLDETCPSLILIEQRKAPLKSIHLLLRLYRLILIGANPCTVGFNHVHFISIGGV